MGPSVKCSVILYISSLVVYPTYCALQPGVVHNMIRYNMTFSVLQLKNCLHRVGWANWELFYVSMLCFLQSIWFLIRGILQMHGSII